MGSHAPDTRVEAREPMEAWFRAHGVPHFMHHYSAGSQVPVVALLLCIVLAFEVGAAPWLDVDTVGMILSPLILFVMTLILLPWLRMIFEAGPWPGLSRWSWGVRVVALVVASVLLLLSPLPPPDNTMWVNFALLLCVFATTTMLFSRRLWTSTEPALRRRRRLLVLVICAIAVLFAVEGAAFQRFDVMLWDRGADVPAGLPALVALVALVVFASGVARRCPDAAPSTATPRPAAEFQLVAVPLLLLFIGFETALLPYSSPEPRQQGRIAAAILLGIALVALALTVAGRRHRITASRGIILLAVLAPVFVVAYPLLVWAYFDLEAFDRRFAGLDAFLLSAGINLCYLAVVWFVVSLGLDRLAVWMAGEALRNVRSVAEGVARGLPLLLVFTIFLVMQAELWEVVVEVESWEFWLLVAAMVASALGFVGLSARRVVLEKCVFDSLDDVAAAAVPDSRDPDAPLRAELSAFRNGHRRAGRLTVRLKRLKYLNALAVIVVYQLIVLLPIAATAAVVFWGIGKLAVPAPVAAQWVYGDGAGPEETAQLLTLTFWGEPWTRVALVLGAFSGLYLAVHILSSPDQRTIFFEGADRAMRRRLAVRLAYVWLVPPDRGRDVPAPERIAAWWRARGEGRTG